MDDVRQLDSLYIDGRWVVPCGEARIDVIDPTTELPVASIPAGEVGDVEAAARAAKRAFVPWWDAGPKQRGELLGLVAQRLDARKGEFAEAISRELGAPLRQSADQQVGMAVAAFDAAAALGLTYPFEHAGDALIVREPIGVVACITPWNFPLYQIAAKVGYALAAGCSVVLKPSEVAPVNAFLLAEVMHDIGFPPGVFNLVSGTGPVVGEALALSPHVDMVSFTGSTNAGKRVASLATGTVKRVALELGGKSANVILDDADFEGAVSSGVAAAFMNSGQACAALTRMLVPRSRLEEAEAIARHRAEAFVLGNPFDEATELGPLVSSIQRERVRNYITKGIEEGAKLVTGGAEPPDGLETGYFVRPTVFSDVTSTMTIAQEEIFGPVLSVMPFGTDEEAIEIANDSIYGLSGAVWSGDTDRALRVASRMRTGQVRVNNKRVARRDTPFGGYKQSGLGREHGAFGLEEFLEVKTVFV